MPKSISWLHISDLHARTRGGWDSKRVVAALVKDLSNMQKEKDIRPDLIFFTGDLAFGATQGESMSEQYTLAKEFFDSVRNAFKPPIPSRNIYVVPGNHDIDRSEISDGELSWLRDSKRRKEEIFKNVEGVTKAWRLWMQRFDSYRAFLRAYGLIHLHPEDPHLRWADIQEINGVRIGIAGFNSSWSAADDSDKGKLWTAMDFQIAKNKEELSDVDISFALIHHPGNWYTSAEDPSGMRSLKQNFPIVLHGHEHQEWIEADSQGRLVISAGACYESSWMENGYNLGHIDVESKSGAIWLRQWDKTGEGWVARNISNRTKDGMWPLNGLEWIHQDRNRLDSASDSASSPPDLAVGQSGQHYTNIFCKHISEQLDYLELFGCDIPRELQRHQLSVAYVSLNITPAVKSASISQDLLEIQESDLDPEDSQLTAPIEGSFSFENLIGAIPATGSKLIIFGPAGAGKSTLMRWCAIHASKSVLKGNGGFGVELDANVDSRAISAKTDGEWRKVPFLIRLRDCKDGRLPAAKDLPALLAKHLQAAPAGWVTALLSAGEAVVLLDGVDEIHKDLRPQMAVEIEELVKTYPACSYIVTSRQGAVPEGWLHRLGFSEATVEPMSRDDREEFIDKWFKSARHEIRTLKVGEDLEKTAAGLKQELIDQPDLSLLAANPLVCAMICALYRERQEKLPETPSELCEALIQMLLHRRERETPGMSDKHFVAEWRALLYPQKKSLVADLAWHMVCKGQSQVSNQEALPIVEKAMAATPGRKASDGVEVLHAAIERSGLLRPNGDDYISFLHNTLKEYLAAGRAVESQDWQALVPYADDPAWQPVILFALALGSEQFNNGLISKLLENILPIEKNGKRRAKADREKLAESNARAFFLVRGKRAAKRLSSELSLKVDELTERLLPPAYMQDVEPLAQLGHRLLTQSGDIFANPKWWASQDARMSTRCLRLLRLIGGSKSKLYFSAIQKLASGSSQLTAEWMLTSSELTSSAAIWPFVERSSVLIDNTHVSDLTSLSKLTNLHRLDASNTRIKSLSVFSSMRSLRHLDVSHNEIRDISSLSAHTSLDYLVISFTHVDSLVPLEGNRTLRVLRARNTQISDLSPLSKISSLKAINIDRSKVTDLAPIAEIEGLETLTMKHLQIKDISPLSALKQLSFVDLEGAGIEKVDYLEGLPSLKTLNLSSTPILSLGAIGSLRKLQRLSIGQTKVEFLGEWPEGSPLSYLNASHSLISDLSPLRNCTRLRHLTASHCRITEVSSIENLPLLNHLDLNGNKLNSLAALSTLKQLRVLIISGSEKMDLAPLIGLENLSLFMVVGPENVDRDELERFALKRQDVTVTSRFFSRSATERKVLK